jgi:DnaJ-domain-containing protein 1
MFNKADPVNNLKRFRATLKMRSGESEAGAILIPAHRALRETLNDDGPFIEMEAEDGRHSFILKTEIARIDPHEAPEPRAADRGAHDWSRFDGKDARLVLGVAADASEAEIQAAWRDLAKAYHPDRLAALGLPQEIMRHADRVLARINAAYQRLKNERAG